jgi:hypothetical protein
LGWTRYEKKPDKIRLVGGLRRIARLWVWEGDTTLLTDDEVEAYLRK